MHEKITLPKPSEVSDEILKQSWGNVRDYLDVFIPFLSKKEQSAFLNNPIYTGLDSNEDGSSFYNTYVHEDNNMVMADYEIPHPQLNVMKVFEVQDKDAFKDLVKSGQEAVDYYNKAYEDYSNDPNTFNLYAKSLAEEIKMEGDLVEAAQQVKNDWDYEAKDILTRLEQREYRATTELEKVDKNIDDKMREIERVQQRLESLGDVEDDGQLEYNPFRPTVDKKQLEMSLDIETKELRELSERRQQLQDELTSIDKQRMQTNEETKRIDDQLQKTKDHLELMRSEIEKDINEDRFAEHKEKAVAFMKAMTANNIQRFVDGYTNAYISTRSPFRIGKAAFGPVMDCSRERDLVSKIAAANRRGFPAYDCIIQTDQADQTLCEYWKEKGDKELSPEREQVYRARLFDQASQIEHYLDTMYKTIEDPTRNKLLHDLQFTDPGNDPFHVHEQSARGSSLLRSTAEAYRMGLQNNWRIDDLGTLSYFNYARRMSRQTTQSNNALDANKFKMYDKPKYKDAQHENWLDRMDQLWERVQSSPIYTGIGRNNYLNEMHKLMEEGYQKGYVGEGLAGCFSNTYNFARNPEVEKKIAEEKIQGAIPTDKLVISEDGKKNIESLQHLKKNEMYASDLVQGSLENQSETYEEYIDSIEMDEDLMNKTIVSEEDGPEVENPDMDILFPKENEKQSSSAADDFEILEKPVQVKDWALDDAMQKFGTKRNSFVRAESDTHKNLREAAERMIAMKETVPLGKTSDLAQMAEYLEKLDEVMAYAKIYKKDKAGANTPAGQERLKGAKAFVQYAKNEERRLREAYNAAGNTNVTLDQIRLSTAVERSLQAETKIGRLCENGMPQSKEERAQLNSLVADMLVAEFAQSKVQANKDTFNTLGFNVLKNNILNDKTFQKVMNSYSKKENFNAKDLVNEIRSGNMTKQIAKKGKSAEKPQTPEKQMADKAKNRETIKRANTM